MTAPPILELLVILDNDVFRVELSEGVLEFRIVSEVTEQFDWCTLSTVATEEYCSYICADILAKFFTTPFNHQVVPQEMLYKECHICILGIVDQIESV